MVHLTDFAATVDAKLHGPRGGVAHAALPANWATWKRHETTPRVARLKEKVFARTGSFHQRAALYAEAYRANLAEQRLEVREGLAVKHLLENMAIAIDDDELVVGRQPRWDPNDREARASARAKEYLAAFPGWSVAGWEGHQTLNNERLLADGLDVYKERIRAKLAALRPADRREDVRKRAFYLGALHALEGLANFILRYAQEAERRSQSAASTCAREDMARTAAMCRRVAREPARTLREAVQLAWFAHLAVCVESGEWHQCYCPCRIDHYFRPYYEADLNAGRITPDQAQELVDCYLLKLNGFGVRTQSIQMIMVGGQTRDGRDNSNALSFMVLDTYRRLGLREPSLSLSWHSNLSPDLMRAACDLLQHGYTYPAIFNDDVIVRGMAEAGVPAQDARHYNPGSCVELTVAGRSKSYFVSRYVNVPYWLLLALWNGRDPLTGEMRGPASGPAETLATFDDLMAAFKRQMAYHIEQNAAAVNEQQMLRVQFKRRLLCSCFVEDCIEKGADVEAGGSRYCFTEPQGVGMTTAIDSLVALKRLVYEGRELTLLKFREMLLRNFEGHEAVRRRIINQLPRFGNDDEEADAIARDVYEDFCREVRRHTPFAQGQFHPGFLAWTTYARFGRGTMATPDGRPAGEALSDSAGPGQGRGYAGPTACINSVTKLDQHSWLGGMVLNLKFSPSSVKGEDGLDKLVALVATYLERGGLQVQVNVVGKDTLLAAQTDPDSHRDLCVRVGGFSAYFTDLARDTQDEIISRTAY